MATMRALRQAQDENTAIRKHWQKCWFVYAREVLEHDDALLDTEEAQDAPVRKPKRYRAPTVTFSEQYSIKERRQREKAECMVIRSNKARNGLVSYTKSHVNTCAESVRITPQKLMPPPSIDSNDSDHGDQNVRGLPARKTPAVRESPYAAAGRIPMRVPAGSGDDDVPRHAMPRRHARQNAPRAKEQLVRAVSWRMPEDSTLKGRGNSHNSSPSRTANSGRHFSSARSSSASPERKAQVNRQARQARRVRRPSSSAERGGDSDGSSRSGRGQRPKPRRLATNLMKTPGGRSAAANTVKMVPKQRAQPKAASHTPAGSRSLKHMMSSAKRCSSRSGSDNDSDSDSYRSTSPSRTRAHAPGSARTLKRMMTSMKRDTDSEAGSDEDTHTTPKAAQRKVAGPSRSLKRLVSTANRDSDSGDEGGSRSTSSSPTRTPKQGGTRTLQRMMTSIRRDSESDADTDKASSRGKGRPLGRTPAAAPQTGSRSLRRAVTASSKARSEVGSIDDDDKSSRSAVSSRPSPTRPQPSGMSRSLKRLVTSATQRNSDSDTGSDKDSKSNKTASSSHAHLSNSRSLRRLMSTAHNQDSDDEDPLQNSLLMMYGIPR